MRDLAECPVCGHRGFAEVFAPNFSGTAADAAPYFLTDRQKAVHGRIVRCGSCGFVFTSPQFSAAEYEQIYCDVALAEKPPGRSRAVSARFNRLADHVRGYVGSGRFFDFGCGGGGFLDCMPGYDGVGLELRSSEVMAQRGEDSRIILGSLRTAIQNGLLAPASFEFVTAWDVLEHLPDLEDDVLTLKGLIKPGGHFFCTVPNVASAAARLSGEKWNCYLLEHLWYFSPKTLRQFMERLGFQTCAVRPFLFPADIETLSSRIAQTYGLRLPVPRAISGWTLPLPAGVSFAAFQAKP
jgi:SAM-dependent methyltransferase